MTSDPETHAFFVLAIDGGAASGKSSTARLLADRLRFLHVDTGSHYRAIAYAALQAGVPAVAAAPLLQFIRDLQLDTAVCGHQSMILINGQRLSTDQIRSIEVNRKVSDFAAVAQIREAVRAYQQNQVNVARQQGFNGVVMEGRDIGTVILPYADLKVFLTADPDTRQLRRSNQGDAECISHRDKTDAGRRVAPLRAAGDAVILDNSCLDLENVVEKILQLVNERRGPSPLSS